MKRREFQRFFRSHSRHGVTWLSARPHLLLGDGGAVPSWSSMELALLLQARLRFVRGALEFGAVGGARWSWHCCCRPRLLWHISFVCGACRP